MIVTGILDVLAVTSVLDDCVGLVFVFVIAVAANGEKVADDSSESMRRRRVILSALLYSNVLKSMSEYSSLLLSDDDRVVDRSF